MSTASALSLGLSKCKTLRYMFYTEQYINLGRSHTHTLEIGLAKSPAYRPDFPYNKLYSSN
jgi:hypothetical protein